MDKYDQVYSELFDQLPTQPHPEDAQAIRSKAQEEMDSREEVPENVTIH